MKRNFLYGMSALAVLGLASCSSETLDTPTGNEPSQVDRKVYVNLAIKGDLPGTRASSGTGSPDDNDTDFTAGEGQESAIKDVYFVFYDESGEVVGNIVQMNISQFTSQTVTTPSATVEKKYYSVVEVDVLKGQTPPTQVMCYANPISPTALQNPLNTIQTVTREEVTVLFDRTPYFPMSNSVYYNAKGDVVMTAAVPKTFNTYAEAKSALDDLNSEDITNIYLERYASKLNFTFPSTNATYTAKAGAYNADGSFNTEGPAVVLTFNVDGWDVNAQANTTYAVKSFRQRGNSGEILGTNETKDALDALINDATKLNPSTGTWAWNNPDFNRSYWAKSPAYFQDTYPEVASDLEGAVINQTYLSYNDIKNNGNKDIDGKTPHYYRETTVGQAALKSANPAAAMPSVVIVGHYSMSVGGAAVGEGTNGVSFYTYQDYTETTTSGEGESATTTTVKKPYIYFENTANSYTSAVTGGTSMLYRFLKQQSTLRKLENGNYRIMTPDELVNICEVIHPVITNPDENLADRRVTLQIKQGANTTDIYVANGNGYQTIGEGEKEITLAKANDVLRNQVGYAIYYNGGMGFYNILIRHLGWYRTGNANNSSTNKKIDWGKVNVGDFGMVRNHAYNVIVDNVFGLATGIAGADTEIVPPSDYTEYYMALRINILKWAIVPAHHVDL